MLRALLPLAASLGCGFQAQSPPDAGPAVFTIASEDADGGYLSGVWGSGADDVLAVGDTGTVMHYDGQLWNPSVGAPPTDKDLTAVWGTGRDDVYVVGSNRAGDQGIIVHFDGLAWSVEADNLPGGLNTVGGVAGDVWAGGRRGLLYRKVGKLDWAQEASLPENPVLLEPDAPELAGVAASSARSVLIGGGPLALYYFDGSEWSSIFSPNEGHFFFAPWAAPGDSQFLVGGNDFALWRFTPPKQLDLLHEENVLGFGLHGVWGSDSRHVVFVGEIDRVMTWNGVGVGMEVLPGGKSHDLYGVWGSSPDDVWIVGTDRVIVRARHLF